MRSFISFLFVCLLVSLFVESNVFATTPIAVDVYQDMESGNAGDVLTASVMNASSHGQQGWGVPGGVMWVSTVCHRDLPGPVIVSGTTYNGTGGSRCWVYNYNLDSTQVSVGVSNHPNITVACYYTPFTTLTQQPGYDTIGINGNYTFACMQTIGGPQLRPHSKTGDGVSTGSYTSTPVTPGKTYWINMKYDTTVAEVFLAIFDPDNSYAQVGTTLISQAAYGDVLGSPWFGHADQHGNDSNDPTQGYFDQILVDYTNGAFPLLVCGPNDTTAPGAPPVVRDGTGQDQSIALSTTQLSANWDMALDNGSGTNSGIKGYQYAIGTTQGGTNVVNWTTIPCQLGITKTGLSLTSNQTYYFSVKAINGVGLTGPATNSDGQTVASDSSAPSAPARVWDAAYHTIGPDIDCVNAGAGVCMPILIPPPITKAASATISLALAPRRALPTPSAGRTCPRNSVFRLRA